MGSTRLNKTLAVLPFAALLIGCGGEIHHHQTVHPETPSAHVDAQPHDDHAWFDHRYDAYATVGYHEGFVGPHDLGRGYGPFVGSHASYHQHQHQHAHPSVLQRVRHAAHPDFYRLVFDVSDPHGHDAALPHAALKYDPVSHSIEVRLEGVNHDVSANALGTPVTVGHSPVEHFARRGQDSLGTVYRVQLTRQARYRLFALRSPSRIVLDVE
jgi:hypothetical protein